MICELCKKEIDLIGADCWIETINYKFNLCIDCQMDIEDFICKKIDKSNIKRNKKIK